MKVAFTGAGGTGKTTLAEHIHTRWETPFLTNVAREVMRLKGIENEAAQNLMSDEDLLDLQYSIFLALKQRRESEPSFVTDRLLLDNYVYALRRCGHAMSENLREQWEKAAIEDLYRMDLVFYCPAGLFPLKADGMRQADVAHQYLIDSAIYGLLCKHAFDRQCGHVYVVNMGDLKRRESYVDALVSEIFAQEA
jgi:nicotinamide riboside kinase